MGLLKNLLNKNNVSDNKDEDILAVCTGELIPPEKITDTVFSKQMMGKTIGIEPTDGTICSPCDGVIEVIFPTGHAFAIRTNDGTGILIHIGVDTVSMNGEGFKTFKKQGEEVKAGETVVEVDIDKVKETGRKPTTMIIISEPAGGRVYNYIDYGPVKKGQVISK